MAVTVKIDGAVARDGTVGRFELFERGLDGKWWSEDRDGSWDDTSIGGAIAHSVSSVIERNKCSVQRLLTR